MLEQIHATRGIFGRFLFADYRFAEKIDSEPDPLFSSLAQRLHHFARISPGDELARHSGNIPAQDLPADPRHDFGQLHSGADERRVTVAHVLEILVEMA